MFIISQEHFQYNDPWSQTFNDRLKRLICGDFRIAYFYEYPDNSTFRYRIYNMIQVISNKFKNISASFFCNADILMVDKIIDNCDLLIICRVKYSNHINSMIIKAKNRGIRVIFDVDDLIFDVNYVHLILNTLDQKLDTYAWDFWFAYIGRIGATLKLCDSAITTNKFLANMIGEFAKIPTHVIPNFLNKEQLEVSHKIYEYKTKSSFKRNDSICLGYFSGTPSHNKDFGLLTKSLIEIFKRNANVNLRIVGFMDVNSELNKYKERIELCPLQDFINLQRLIGEVEINLIPLQNNVFTNCKSELKYFEAAICGTLSIASPTFVYKECIQDGYNGYIANDIEWVDKILHLIDNINDSYQRMAQVAYCHAIDNYAWFNQEKPLLEMINV
ncbi:MAG TPA: glycosyltransferase [Burkholderiales bacterium]|nr:glycosyltransferase [Burkholderiales bacterium]